MPVFFPDFTAARPGRFEPGSAMLTEMVNLLMSAEIDAVRGASYGERTQERVNSCNCYRPRPWDTRVGNTDLQIPKLRHGTYFPGWLLEPRRRRHEAAQYAVSSST
jgi:putative transposase